MKTLIHPTTTHDNYWDCNCKDNYIHSKNHSVCPVCGADQEEAPDSIVEEIAETFIGKKVKVVHDYFKKDESIVLNINRYEVDSEEGDGETILWDDSQSQWCSIDYAQNNLI